MSPSTRPGAAYYSRLCLPRSVYKQLSIYIYNIYNQIFTISRSVPSCAANVTAAFTVTRDIDWTGTFGETRLGIYTHITAHTYTIYMLYLHYLHRVTAGSRQECMERCAAESSFVCRAALWQPGPDSCRLARWVVAEAFLINYHQLICKCVSTSPCSGMWFQPLGCPARGVAACSTWRTTVSTVSSEQGNWEFRIYYSQ